MQSESLEGVGVLQHLQKLVLMGNPLRTASYLNPLPQNITTLNLTSGSSRLHNPRLDFSAVLSQHTPQQMQDAYTRNPAGSINVSTSGGRLLSLDISGVDLHEPSVLSNLTRLTALHAACLHSRKRAELLAVLPCLCTLRHLDLAIKEQYGSYFPCDYNSKLCNPCFGTADLKRLVSGCPELEWLSVSVMPRRTPAPYDPLGALYGVLPPPPPAQPEPCSLLPLQDATRLTSLTLWANKLLQDSHLTELATLTGLQFLETTGCGDSITDRGIQELTQLTALTSLRVDVNDARSVSEDVAPSEQRHRYVDIADRGSGNIAHMVG